MHPFHVSSVLALQPDDFAPFITFAQWYLGKILNYFFPAKVLFSDGAYFTRKKKFNTHNANVSVKENPLAIQCCAAQN